MVELSTVFTANELTKKKYTNINIMGTLKGRGRGAEKKMFEPYLEAIACLIPIPNSHGQRKLLPGK